MKKKNIILLVGGLVVAAVLVAGIWRGSMRATIRGAQIDALEAMLKEQSDAVTDLQVSVARPTANFEIYVQNAQGEELLSLMKTVADYINGEQLYETLLMPEFRLPHIWADGIQITFYQGWGPFARSLQQYDCLHDSTEHSYEEIAGLGFRQWQLRYDSFAPDRQLPEVVYEAAVNGVWGGETQGSSIAMHRAGQGKPALHTEGLMGSGQALIALCLKTRIIHREGGRSSVEGSVKNLGVYSAGHWDCELLHRTVWQSLAGIDFQPSLRHL